MNIINRDVYHTFRRNGKYAWCTVFQNLIHTVLAPWPLTCLQKRAFFDPHLRSRNIANYYLKTVSESETYKGIARDGMSVMPAMLLAHS